MLALLSACQPPVLRICRNSNSIFILEIATNWTGCDSTTNSCERCKYRSNTDTWGAARSEGRKHQGTDIFAARGTAVIAATDGIVHKIGLDGFRWQSRFGLLGPALSRTLLCAPWWLCPTYSVWRLGASWWSYWFCWHNRQCPKTHHHICIMAFIYVSKGLWILIRIYRQVHLNFSSNIV